MCIHLVLSINLKIMKSTSLVFTTAFVGVAMLLGFTFVRPNSGVEYKASTDKSAIKWVGRKVTGEHNGTVALKSGSVSVDGTKISGGKFEIDLSSVTCADLTDQTYNQKLIEHLKSDDFFSTAKHPTALLEIVSGTKTTGDKYDIKGRLTIKGITKDITFPATVKVTDKNLVAIAKVKIDRTQYDIRYGSASFFEGLGDKAISNDFELDVNIAATR